MWHNVERNDRGLAVPSEEKPSKQNSEAGHQKYAIRDDNIQEHVTFLLLLTVPSNLHFLRA